SCNLLKQLVLCGSIQLCNLLGRINVADSVRRSTKLELKVLSPLLCLVSSNVTSSLVWQLDENIKTPRTRRFIHRVKKTELLNQSLKSRVWLIHHRVEGVLYNGDVGLCDYDLSTNPSEVRTIVIHLDT